MEELVRKQLEVVAGLIFDRQKLLLCQRHRSGAFPLKWEFPGGKIEAGESHVSALARELKEELAIDAGETKLLHRHIHTYPDGLDVALSFFHVIAYQGEIKNLVFEQITWSELTQLTDFDFLEGDLPIVRLLADGSLSPNLAKS